MSNYYVFLHPTVTRYLDSLKDEEKKRCYRSLKKLEENPLTPRTQCDIKTLSGKKRKAYRLMVGDHRFTYVIKEKEVYIREGFRRGKGY